MRLKFDEALCDPEALKLNHYNRELWMMTAIEPELAVARLSGFLEKFRSVRMVSKKWGREYLVSRLAGYNAARFDKGHLRRLAQTYGAFLAADPCVLDVMQRAMWYCVENQIELADFKLKTVCRHFGIEIGEVHTALDDCRATVELAKLLMVSEQRRELVRTLELEERVKRL